ncbi:MAG TPA: DUF4175 family protein, partial [Hyphomicrobiaceae bacterium]|nr:DUF4175 family protein [Hyphomicrobiaceae bacterium]
PADSPSGRLWVAHRDRLQRLLDRLRVGGPKPRTDRYDPIGLRVLLGLGLVVAFAFAGDSVSDRLRSAFRFGPSQAQIAEARLDAWVTPPAYTGRPPVMLADGARGGFRPDLKGEAIEVPERSQIVVRTAGTVLKALALEIEPDGGPVMRLEADASAPVSDGRPAGVIELKSELKTSATVRVVTRGVQMVSWRFKVIPDTPPKIALTKNPESLPRGSLKLSYKVEDDYGVITIDGRLRRVARKAGDPATAWARPKPKTGPRLPMMRPPHLVLRLPRDNARSADGVSFHDLGAHPWAGTRVRLGLVAKDALEQTGRSEVVEFVLPARQFRKTLAKAIVEQRRKLVEDSRNVPDVLEGIEAITFAAADFNMDRGVFLGLRAVYHRLQLDRNAKTPHGTRQVLASAVEHLWHIALRAEDGNLSAAERRLRDAQDRLAEALKNGATDEELRQLMQELRQALN